ncbi:MAG: SIMPL domain-containing protein [Flavobacteriales bacterium]|nr:SIMPL domain-containing protein [Flavobacteriales bacterium]
MKNLLFLLVFCSTLFTAQAQNSILKVKGEATVSAVPELMNVVIPLQAKAESYQATSDQLTKTYNELNAALVKAGIENEAIKSNSMSINADYQYIERQRQLVGYLGTIRLSIELERSQKNMNAIINTLKNEAFNFGYNLSFSLSEKQKESLLEDALTKAVEDGKRKAEILSGSLDVKIITLQEVNYGYMDGGRDVFEPRYLGNDTMEMKLASDEAPSLNPNEIEVRKEVGLIWKVAK